MTGDMAYDAERRPGGWVSRKAARRERLIWLGFGAFFVFAGLLIALLVGHKLSITASALFLGATLAFKPYAERYIDATMRWRSGARAEQVVGETLNQLRLDGWILMHDVEQAGEGNIDHIASGPTGVYLIETKQRRYEDRQLVKAKRQAAKLHDEIGVWVTPVICLHERKGSPFRTNGVWIVPCACLLNWLRAQTNRPVEFQRLAAFADRLGTTAQWR